MTSGRRIAPTDVVTVSPRALLTELGDGTGVVLDLETKFYFNLNGTGVGVWKDLAAHVEGVSPQVLAERLASRFEVTVEAGLVDVLALLQTMLEEGLVKLR